MSQAKRKLLDGQNYLHSLVEEHMFPGESLSDRFIEFSGKLKPSEHYIFGRLPGEKSRNRFIQEGRSLGEDLLIQEVAAFMDKYDGVVTLTSEDSWEIKGYWYGRGITQDIEDLCSAAEELNFLFGRTVEVQVDPERKTLANGQRVDRDKLRIAWNHDGSGTLEVYDPWNHTWDKASYFIWEGGS